MDDRDKLLESLGFEIADGSDPDFSALEKTDPDLSANLRSLSIMARYYQELRREDEALGVKEEALPEAPRATWGHLDILEQVGEGTHGCVYRARDRRLNRLVALKLIHRREGHPSILKEAEHLARVKHPNLVTIHGAEMRDGDLGLWMEYIEGTTLHDLIAEQGPMGGREAVLLGIDLCGALAALHGAGLLHRDIKAHNVMREQGGRFVLMDLSAGADVAASQAADPARLSGTPLYQAPEVMAGGEGGVCAEIYSLGVLLYYAVTGSYPVKARDYHALKEQHANGARRHLRDVRADLPATFVDVIERATAPDTNQRFASAGEMEQALSAALRSDAPAQAEMRAEPRRGRIMSFWFGLTAAVALAAIPLFLWPGFLIPKTYTIAATLHRVGASADEQLLPGARVAPGDRLYMEFEASREMHVYVLAEDDRGSAFLLFPIEGHALANPLPAHELHRLPPALDGQRYSWGVSSVGGTEHLLIVASPEALTDFEQTLALLPTPRATSAIPLDQEALEGLRGMGHLLAEEPTVSEARTRPAFALARRLAGGPEENRGIWVRQIDLVNPGP